MQYLKLSNFFFSWTPRRSLSAHPNVCDGHTANQVYVLQMYSFILIRPNGAADTVVFRTVVLSANQKIFEDNFRSEMTGEETK